VCVRLADKLHIEAADAYGEGKKKISFTVDREKMPESIDLKIGKYLKANQPNGKSILVSISAITDEQITLKADHPLAGKDLNFEIELVEIV
jgi:FKBP-type peptidyl-prolyl cis-trans isomerase 2